MLIWILPLVAAAAFGLAMGWVLRAKVEIARESDPEAELRVLRGKQALYASKIRSLHLELAQLESKLATLKAAGVDIGKPIEPVPLDDAAMDARLASIIGVFEEEPAAPAEEEDVGTGFMSILPTDLADDHAAAFGPTEEPEFEEEPAAEEPAAEEPAAEEPAVVRPLPEMQSNLAKRVAAALASEAGDVGAPKPVRPAQESERHGEPEPRAGEVAPAAALQPAGQDFDEPPEVTEELPDEGAVPSDVQVSEDLVAESVILEEHPLADEHPLVEELPGIEQAAVETGVPTARPTYLSVVQSDEIETPAVAPVESEEQPVQIEMDEAGVEIDLREPDDLTLIKGIGPKISAMLHEMGLSRFEDVASLDEAGVEELAGKLGSFHSRIERDDWVGQARQLAEARSGVSAAGRGAG